MKRIIFSTAISLAAIMANAQTSVPSKQVNYDAAAWTFNTVSMPDEISKPMEAVHVSRADSITIRVYKDTDGEVVKTLRYYTAVDLLPVQIRSKFSKKFADYVPTAIIEEHDMWDVNYIVNLSKGTRWMQVHSSPNGRVSILHRYYSAHGQ